MSNQPTPALTEEQTAAVDKLINDNKASMVAAVVEIIEANQKKVISDVPNEIKKAVEEHQQVVLAKVSPGTDGNKESKWFKVALVVIPVLATAIMGFYIDRKVDRSKQEITTRLAIQEEFFKRKLSTYEKAYAQMADFNEAPNNVRADPTNVEAGTKAFESMAELDKFRRSNALYISPAVMSELGKVWQTGANVLNDPKSAKKNPLTEKITSVEKLMQEDLQVQDLGRISDVLKK